MKKNIVEQEFLNYFEKELGFSLYEVNFDEIESAIFSNIIEERQYYRTTESFLYYKKELAYSFNEKNEVNGINLNYANCYKLPDKYLLNFKNLEKLFLKQTRFKNYKFLKKMKSLKYLDLSYCDLEESKYTLNNLNQITHLNLTSTNINDISFLKNYKNIESLNLNFNRNIKNYSSFNQLIGLKSLKLKSCNFKDSGILPKIETLQELDLSSTDLSNIDFIVELKNLTHLYLSKTQITNFENIKNLKNLQVLDISHNYGDLYEYDYDNISFSFIEDLKNIVDLNLNSCGVIHISQDEVSNHIDINEEIIKKASVTKFNFNGKEIYSNIGSLIKKTKISRLKLAEDLINDFTFINLYTSLINLEILSNEFLVNISFLSNLNKLEYLDLSECKNILDYSPIKNIKSLKVLKLLGNNLTNIDFLEYLTNLQSLDISNNSNISDYSFIGNLKNLQSLKLKGNNIKEVSFLKGIDSIEFLDLSDNNIIDLQDIKHLLINKKFEITLSDLPLNVVFNGNYNEAVREFFLIRTLSNSSFQTVNENVQPAINVDKIAEITTSILEKTTDERGLMFGLFGKWGRGKTFLWQQIKDLVVKQNKIFLPVEFHAWKYQETPASWAYLYETLTDKIFGKGLKKVFRVLLFNFKRITNLSTFKILLSIVLFFITLFSFLVFLKNIVWEGLIDEITNASNLPSFLKMAFPIPLSIALAGISSLYILFRDEFVIRAKDLFKKYTTKLSHKELLGIQAEIEKDIEALLLFWSRPVIEIEEEFNFVKRLFYNTRNFIYKKLRINKRILLFVDDLDRCSEERIVQIIDALKVMLENEKISKRMIVFSAIDERILKRAIRSKYKNLLDDNSEKIDILVKEYFDKLFLLGLKLGKINEEEKLEIFNNFTAYKIKEISISEINNYYNNADKGDKSKRLGKTQKSNNSTIVKDAKNNNDSNYKIENEKSNEISEPKIFSNSANIYIEKQSNYDDITSIEAEYFRYYLKFNYTLEITPRIIRIIYYRYLLARSILINVKNVKFEVYKFNTEIILALIFEFSIIRKAEDILLHKVDIENEKNASIEIPAANKVFNIDKQTYLKIIDVIEMVVPY